MTASVLCDAPPGERWNVTCEEPNVGDAAIEQACKILRLPTVRDRHGEIAAAAARQQTGYKAFLTELLSLECDDRDARRTLPRRQATLPDDTRPAPSVAAYDL